MKSNVLSFVSRSRSNSAAKSPAQSGEVVSLSEHRKRARRVRTATCVYFVSRVLQSPEDYTAA